MLAKAGTWHLSTYRAELALLKQECQKRQETLAILKDSTWDLRLLEDKDGRFIILPMGTKAATNWTVGKQAAIKLEH